MKFSIVIPTNRSSNAAIARLLECSTLDPERFEVIVRDNSGDERKRAVLRGLAPPLKVEEAPNRGAFENSIEALRLATGEFVFFVADDDWVSVRGLRRLYDLASECLPDAGVSCVTGTYFLETSTQSGMFRYSGLDDPSPEARVGAYFNARAPNVLFYSGVRRDLANFCFGFMDSLPFKFSYHDQLVSLLYLACGTVRQIEPVVYFYDLGEWETDEKTLAKDRSMYVAAGLPEQIDRLHHLIAGMEGALLLKSRLVRDRVPGGGERLINVWFGNLYQRFRQLQRTGSYPPGRVDEAMQRVATKWMSQSAVDLNELLFDVTDAIEVADAAAAARYFDYWSAL